MSTTTTTTPASSQLPPLTLHHLHISQSERIVFLLEELSLPYTLKLYTRSPLLSPPDLAALTPQKSAPVLTTTNLTTGEEFHMSESGAIAEYINTVYGASRLSLPPTHANYPDYLFWMHFANGTLQSTVIRGMTMRMLDVPPSHPLGAGAAASLAKSLGTVDARLATTRAWLAGEQFTLADVMNVVCLTTMRQWSPFSLQGYPAIVSYLQRIGEREGYRRAMDKAEEGMDWKAGLSVEGPALFGPFEAVLRAGGAVFRTSNDNDSGS